MLGFIRVRYLSFFHSNYFPYLVLFLLPFLLFWRASSGRDLFVMGDLSGSDLLELHLPFKYILHDAYTHGQFPLWTPYLSNGFPFLAEGQSGPLYLPNIIFAFLPPYLSLNYSILLTFVIAGWGMYTYARTLPLMGKYGAVSCAVIFMLCSFFIARMKHLNMIVVAAYLPWCLWSIRTYFLTFRFRFFVLLGVFVGVQFLAGHPQMTYFCFIMCVWYCVGELVYRCCIASSALLYFVQVVCGLTCSVLIAAGLSAAQLLPTYELSQLSNRLSFSYQTATAFPLSVSFLSSFFAPFFLGNPASGSYKGNIQTDGIWWENVMYIGLLPLLLVVVLFIYRVKGAFLFFVHSTSLFSKKWWKSVSSFSYLYCFFVLSFFVFLILGMGNFSFLFKILYFNIPGMSLFRFPNRFILFSLFSMCIMAGWGIERLTRKLEHSRADAQKKSENSDDYIFSWPFPLFYSRILFLALIFLDLGVFAYQYVSFYPASEYLRRPAFVQSVSKRKDLFRIYPTTQYGQNPFGTMGWNKEESRKAIISLQNSVPGNFSPVYHLFSFTDRGWFEGGLGIKDRYTLEHALVNESISIENLSRILGLWNVRYIIGFNDYTSAFFNPAFSYKLDSAFSLPLQVFENQYVLPRSYYVPALKHADSIAEVFNNLVDPNLFSRLYAYTTDPVSSLPQATVSAAVKGEVSMAQYEFTEVSMVSSAEKEGYVVFSDTFYPGWKVYVDGKERPLLSVNLVQRAVKVPAGKHYVVWSYQPIVFYIGFGISFATLILVIGFGIGWMRQGRVVVGKSSQS